MPIALPRRQLLQSAGALIVALPWPGIPRIAEAAGAAPDLPAYLRVAADGLITVLSPTTEMGQGTHTAHAAIIADELGADLASVRVEVPQPAEPFRRAAPTGRGMASGGSWGVRYWYEILRVAAAQAREVLTEAAAARLAVPAGELTVENGQVMHTASGRSLAFGELAADAAALPLPENPRLRDRAAFRYVGQEGLQRLDIPDKTRGATVFSMDLRLPGMVHACARLNPRFRGEAEGFDRNSALRVAGVLEVVAVPGGAAVVAESSWAALRGAEALAIRFKATEHDALDSATITADMKQGLDSPDAMVGDAEGDAAAGLATAARAIAADYEVPYLAHMPMEPWNCTVRIADGLVEVWAPTQAQDRALRAAAAAAKVAPEQVRIHSVMPGGGFGRRLLEDGIPAAVLAAQAMGRPVKYFWRREDDIGQGWYRPAQMARLKAGFDADGKVVALHIRTSGPSVRRDFNPGLLDAGELDDTSVQTLTNHRYRVGAYLVDNVLRHNPVPCAPWRAVGATQNGFFLECFLDEMAAALGKDPYRFRRELLAHDPRALAVIDTVAEHAGWDTPPPTGRARGIAFVESYGSLCAHVAEVSLDGRRVVVHRVVVALDCGDVITPDAARAQVEGGVVQGLSAALAEAVTIRDGQAAERNFDSYPVLRIGDTPAAIEIHFVRSPGEALGGVGEPPLPPVAPAVVNALAVLTGTRIRRLPIRDALPA
jgi:isoquinoline 1-oxidoreductase beta subunit